MRAGIQPTCAGRPEVNLDVTHGLTFGSCVEVLGVEESAAILLLAPFGPAFLHLSAQVTGFGQLILLQVRGTLRSGDLRLKVPLLEMHFIEFVGRNVATEAAAAAVGVAALVGLHGSHLLPSPNRALVATLHLKRHLRPLFGPTMLAVGLLVAVVALLLLLIALALQKKLVLLDLVHGVVAVVLQLLSGAAARLIIFNQNCLSVCALLL